MNRWACITSMIFSLFTSDSSAPHPNSLLQTPTPSAHTHTHTYIDTQHRLTDRSDRTQLTAARAVLSGIWRCCLFKMTRMQSSLYIWVASSAGRWAIAGAASSTNPALRLPSGRAGVLSQSLSFPVICLSSEDRLTPGAVSVCSRESHTASHFLYPPAHLALPQVDSCSWHGLWHFDRV